MDSSNEPNLIFPKYMIHSRDPDSHLAVAAISLSCSPYLATIMISVICLMIFHIFTVTMLMFSLLNPMQTNCQTVNQYREYVIMYSRFVMSC